MQAGKKIFPLVYLYWRKSGESSWKMLNEKSHSYRFIVLISSLFQRSGIEKLNFLLVKWAVSSQSKWKFLSKFWEIFGNRKFNLKKLSQSMLIVNVNVTRIFICHKQRQVGIQPQCWLIVQIKSKPQEMGRVERKEKFQLWKWEIFHIESKTEWEVKMENQQQSFICSFKETSKR